MKVREVLKLLHEDGWQEVRRHGSHRILKHPTKAGMVILAGNLGGDVPKGLLRTILKQAGLEDTL